MQLLAVRFRPSLSLGLSLCLAFISQAFAIGFDPNFASGGKFMTSFADSGQPSSGGSRVFLQPSGRIVIVGTHQQQGTVGRPAGIAIVCLTSGGGLNTSFGSGGKVLFWNRDANQNLVDSAILGDGSLLILSQSNQSPAVSRPVITKLTSGGQVDPAFSANVELGANQTIAVKLAPGSEGKLYVLVREAWNFYLLRLNFDGSRDATFGTNGVRPINLKRFPEPRIVGLHELEGGKILVIGSHQSFYSDPPAFAARFNPDASLDFSFGKQGVTRIIIGYGRVEAQTSAVQPDGKILIGGYYTFLGSNAVLIRLTPRGRPDSGFGDAGIAMTAFNNWNGVHGIAIAADGRIIVAGRCGSKTLPQNQRLFVARFSTTGVRESFLVTNFITDRDAGAQDVVLQPDGKIIVAAFTLNQFDNFTQLSAARFVP